MDKLFKCTVCDNYTLNRYLGRWVHKSCFDHIIPIIVQKFNVHNHIEVMEQLIVMRNWQEKGFIDVDNLCSILSIVNQKIETVKEP